MNRLSLRHLLYMIAIVPLIGFLCVSLVSVWDSYGRYSVLERQMIVQKLATTGGRLAQVVPAEAFATPGTLADRRKTVDDTILELTGVYTEWKQQGNSDPAIEKAYTFIIDMAPALATFRSNVDAEMDTVAESMRVMQPMSAAGLELVRRSGAEVNDLALSRFIQGYHALMQVNDAGLIDIRSGRTFLSGETLSLQRYGFVLHAKGLRDRYSAQMKEFLPPAIVAEITAFEQSDDGQFLTDIRQQLLKNEAPVNDQQMHDKWQQVSGAQAGLMGDLIARTGAALNDEANRLLSNVRFAFLRDSILALGVSLLVGGLCFGVVRTVSRMIRGVEQRMHGLADGDLESDIPYSERSDEIGEMARSVEVFRQSAIRNAKLESEAEENRERAEQERVEVQQRAEAEAEQRLTTATGSLAQALRRLAAGDMTCEIEEEFAPQFEALRTDFNASVQQLRAALLSVGQTASAVSGGSGEISNASDNLAKRTEQQAASLEQTAAALAQITTNVRATSNRTGEARDIVRDTRSRAEQSGLVVADAVSAMERIEHASHQISKIIGVIDEIAFQTNLLALNAGVEAARAGEAGKGFAVVAQEVRELAGRSATAAKEIKELITNSELAVSEGVKLVNDTGTGLSAIAEQVQDINQHMDAITTAAEEQSSDLGEVNTAVNHMDQATQQNAAMVEEMNAASAGLAQEAASLAELLSKFQTAVGNQTRQHSAPVAKAAVSAPAPTRSSQSPKGSSPAMPAVAGNTALAEDNWEEF
ncbi:methyl-accepting chemotaxis protein [Hoeflea sp.]|uniref:methyl-accepting chemotaxis protein n=1 Tax=Hoeflea sp. TaxID=1940281 RepID=UPI003747B542